MTPRQAETTIVDSYYASLSHPGSGGWTTLGAEVLAVVVFLIWIRPLWRSWLPKSLRSQDNRNDGWQLASLHQYPSPHPIYYVPVLGTDTQGSRVEEWKVRKPVPKFSTNVDSREVRKIGVQGDGPAAPVLEPFDTPENVVYPSQIVTASPVPGPDLSDQTRPPSPLTSPLLNIPTRAVVNTPVSAQPRRLSSVLETRKSLRSMHSHYARTLSSSAYTGYFSRSTSSKSTLPPSYRSNRPTAYIAPSYHTYPPFPPPTYAPPPSAFRMNLNAVPESLRPGWPGPRPSGLDRSSGSERGYGALGADADSSGIDNAGADGGRTESGTSRTAEKLTVSWF